VGGLVGGLVSRLVSEFVRAPVRGLVGGLVGEPVGGSVDAWVREEHFGAPLTCCLSILTSCSNKQILSATDYTRSTLLLHLHVA
jgi:hypothetical protein